MLALIVGSSCASAPMTRTLPDARWQTPQGPITTEAVTGLLATASHVYVAEHHADVRFHSAQLTVLDLVRRAGRAPTIAIEWLPRRVQPAIDQWLRGAEGIDQLAEAVDWQASWAHDLAAYAPMLLWARRNGLGIVALNADRDLSRAVARHGPEGLPPELKERLPALDSRTEGHFDYFAARMREMGAAHGHALSDDALERYYLAQLVWDETMSAAIVELLAAGAPSPVVVFAGAGHIDFGHGIPRRAAAGSGQKPLIVRPWVEPTTIEAGRADLFIDVRR